MEDRLSTLPDDILFHIFSEFGMMEVIQASALSKRFRYFWKNHPSLFFNSITFLDPDKAHTEIEYVDPTVFPNSRKPKTKNKKFADFVTQVLDSRTKNSIINTFFVFSYEPCSISNIQSWVRNVTECNIQRLCLQFHVPDFTSLALPPSFFTCHSLTSVLLTASMLSKSPRIPIPLPPSIDMPLLKELKLQSVSQFSTQFLDKIFCGCPQLEKLKISLCEFDESRKLEISSQQLKKLTINWCMPNDIEEVFVTINSPSLTSFVCMGWSEVVYLLKSISSLETAHLDMRRGHAKISVEDAKRTMECYRDPSSADSLALDQDMCEVGGKLFVKLYGEWKYEKDLWQKLGGLSTCKTM